MSPGVLDPKYGGYAPASQQSSSCTFSLTTSSASSARSAVSSDVSETSSVASSQDHDHQDADLPSPSELVRCAPRNAIKIPIVPIKAAWLESNLNPSQARQAHPRRSHSATQRPPRLARSDERKTEFVNDLVDSATSMVEIIWPRRDSSQCKRALGQGPLTTRIYIEETLRRSRTSYSTLQVALYYLILFKHNMPTAESPSMALQCGRRMFLAALILASKYLQDRNYSAKAWSKMCGLNTSEINHNERNFLRIVDWNLHIPDRVFKRWTDVVLRFTTSQLRGSTPLQSQLLWRQVIPFLTPELDDPRLPISSIEDMGCPTPETGPSSPNGSFGADRQEEVMPAPAFIQPPSQVPVAPYPAMTPAHSPETPGLRRMGLLPTPSLTPSTVAASTPTVSVCGLSERHASYRESALACLSRCGSLAPSVFSLASSPESMITDTSSLASSHSSVAMSAAPQWPSLAITATRLVTEPSKPLRRSTRFQGTARKPIYIEEPQFGGHIDLTQSSFTVEGQTVCTSARKRALPITLCDETIVDANDDEVLVLGDASGSQEPGSLTSAELADPSVSRKRICPSRLSPLRLGGALPTTPPGSTSPEPPTKRPRTGLAPPSTPPKSTSASPDLLVKVGPNEWSVMAD